MTITEPAPAKLNLALHVRARRPDGYHELETLFAFVIHGDELTLTFADAPAFTITGRFAKALAGEGDNLVTRAIAAFDAAFGTDRPVAVTLDKRLPVASGIGGGSADAAAALRGMARLHGVAEDPRLTELAARLGSDVPACLLGRTAIGRGRGELLEPVAGWPGTPVLLVNPGIPVSTAQVFAGWDGIDRGPLPSDPHHGRNDLEPPARTIAPAIGEALDLLAPEATLARMSGSGATCFALYSDDAARARAAARLRAARPGWWCLETALA